MKHRWTAWVLLATLALGALTACGGGSGTQASPVSSGGNTSAPAGSSGTGTDTEATSTATP